MTAIAYPAPLLKGDKIAICAFSSGVDSRFHDRLDLVLNGLRSRGYQVVEGDCLRQQHNPPEQRAAELMQFLTDDSIAAIMPPWGGELTMEILPLLDFNAISKARPKWLVGFSDISTFSCALTTRCGWATLHSANLMQIHPDDSDPFLADIFAALTLEKDQQFVQSAASHYQLETIDYSNDAESLFNYTQPSQWRCINYQDKREIEISGRMIGGCLDTLGLLLPSNYYALHEFKRHYAQDGLILYLENVELSPTALARCLLSLKLSDVFTDVNGVIFGRSPVANMKNSSLDYYQAIDLAFQGCLFPVIVDADIGHIAPNMALVNGAYGTLSAELDKGAAAQVKLVTCYK
ncbi:S66 peptidase family protein [Pseudoalteromonas mariniglutinosa]|uniref:S66 family peptidase n=1 Tax=Pseudoalteromonas mariniglutinosa TaxID=206042 RepID=UPI00384B25AC